MATAYETIYNRALAKIQDFELAALPEFDLEEMLHGWMISAISKFRKCKSDLKDRDEENKTFNIDLEDEEIEILSIMIVREHLSPQLHSTLLTQQIFSGKEQNYYSQAAHMRELLEMDNNLKLEAQKLMRDYTYQNDLRGYFES